VSGWAGWGWGSRRRREALDPPARPGVSAAARPTDMSDARDRASGLALALAWAAVLLGALGDVEPAQTWAPAGFAGFLLLQARGLAPVAWLHLGAGAAFTVLTLALVAEPGGVLAEGFRRAGFIAVLFAALGAIREAAQTSPLVADAGRMLVRQPPGRRYFAIAGGGTLFGAILNFGVVALFAGMIQGLTGAQRGVSRSEERERRMMLALLRGFSIVMFWCPLTMAFAVTTATVQGAQWPAMVALGAAFALIALVCGWRIDGLSGREPVQAQPEAFAWSRLAPLAGLLALMSALAIMIDELTAGQLIHGVILFVPLVGFVWLVRDAGLDGARAMGGYVTRQIPRQRSELAILANAAFVGTLIAALLPQGAVDAVLGPQGAPAVLIPPLALLLVVVLGQLGANPLLSVTALATILNDPAAYGVNPSLMASALAVGWGLAVGSSPAAAATMYIGRLTGQRAFTVGGRWNARFTWTTLALCALALMVLHYVV
jgi:hypothetical protein